jgi:hypothetical protein
MRLPGSGEADIGSSPNTMTSGDFDLDGNLDLAWGNGGDATVGVVLGHGTGTFGPYTAYVTGEVPTSIEAADLNGDGRPDLTLARTGAVSALLNTCLP